MYTQHRKQKYFSSSFKSIQNKGRINQMKVSSNANNYRLKTQRPMSSMAESNLKKNQKIIYKQTTSILQLQPQKVIKENLDLKKQLNKLGGQLNLQKAKTLKFQKKTQSIIKQLQIQYSKPAYWFNRENSNLLIGVKHQYDKLKQIYQEKCKEIQKIQLSQVFSQYQQFRIYSSILEKDNQELKNLIKSILKKKNLGIISQQQNQAIIIANLKRSNADLSLKNRNLKRRNNQLKKINIQFHKKQQFQDLLIIQKDNQKHKSDLSYKRTKKQNIQLKNKNAQIVQKMNQIMKSTEKKIQDIKKNEENRSVIERQIFATTMKQKNEQIEEIKKQLAYLSTLLSYWKPLQQIKKSSFHIQHQNQNNKPRLSIRKSSKTKIMSNVQKTIRSSHKDMNNQLFGTILECFVRRDSSIDDALEQQQSIIAIPQQNLSREVKSSAIKHHDSAIKCRKIRTDQVSLYSDVLKYLLIGHQIGSQKFKQFFNYSNDKNLKLSQCDQQWKKQFITESEVEQILLSEPFSLQKDVVHLLGRYFTQDSTSEHNYYHKTNEISRTVLKSIVKAFVGQYLLPHISKCKQEWSQICIKYGRNLQLALKSIASEGLISKKNLFELMDNIDITMSEQTKNWILGVLVVNSGSQLDKLKYWNIFEKDLTIEQTK